MVWHMGPAPALLAVGGPAAKGPAARGHANRDERYDSTKQYTWTEQYTWTKQNAWGCSHPAQKHEL